MSTRFRCCACGRVFGEREALCEDWNDPGRSFICPACGAYLLRAETAGVRVIEAGVRWRRWLPVLPGVLAVILGAVLMGDIWGERGVLAVLGLGGVGLVLLTLRTAEAVPPEETVRVGDLDPNTGPRH